MILGCIKCINKHRYQPSLAFNKVYFHKSYKMPFCPQRHTKHLNFLSLNCGGLTHAIYLKIRRFAVCFSGGKMQDLFFLLENVWDLLLSPSCFTHGSETEMFWQPGTQWYKVISCVTLASLGVKLSPLFFREGVLLQNLFCLQKRHVSQGHNFH